MAWTDEMVDQLREMWREGLTTGEIGRRLGVSKNSIVGKVHRLGLSGRPSPIKKKEDPNAPQEITATKPIKEKSKETPIKEKTETKPIIKAEKAPAKEPEHKEKEVASAPKTEVHAPSHHHYGKTNLTELDNHTCRWPLGDPKDENFYFCGKKVRIGQTYCDEHSSIAYVKTNKK